MPKAYIIVLNYKNWEDTLECLESLYKLDYSNFQIVVVDNASPNDSMSKIIDWAEGKIGVKVADDNALKKLSFPNIPKPLEYILYNQEIAEKGGHGGDNKKLILIQSNENKGYSAGNNIGMRYALAKNDFEYVWILNNDVVVEPKSLTNLAQRVVNDTDKTGIYGVKLKYYHHPYYLQGIGCHYNHWLGKGFWVGRNQCDTALYNDEKQLKRFKINMIIGASILARRVFLEDVGLLNEEYFLYGEELDWSIRAKRKGYALGIALDSVVYHKEGASINSNSKDLSNYSLLSDFYIVTNRIKLARKYFPATLFSVYITTFILILKRVIKGKYAHAQMISKILIGQNLNSIMIEYNIPGLKRGTSTEK
jgi:GT2 family glycosyltransferase